MSGNVATLPQTAAVTVEGTTVTVHSLEVDDAGLADLLRAHPPAEHAEIVAKALTVGARGIITMGLGIDVGAVESRVRETLSAAVDEAERRTAALLEAGETAFAEHFDVDRRTSVIARALAEFARWREDLLGSLDPTGADSYTTRFLQQLADLLGPQGALESRLAEALDPDADGSSIGRLSTSIDERFSELRDLIVHNRGVEEGRGEEAQRGTAQGLDYEDVVETMLRSEAAAIGGCIVERVGRLKGDLSAQATVGDLVVEFPGGGRLVVEAKNQARLGLNGDGGVLAELDDAMANRNAGFALCISKRDAYPAEVGSFGVYGNRVLVVDEGDGVMVRVAMRWARAALIAQGTGSGLEIDAEYVTDRLERIREQAERLKASQRSLTDIGKSVDGVRRSLQAMRAELIDLVDDIHRHTARVAEGS